MRRILFFLFIIIPHLVFSQKSTPEKQKSAALLKCKCRPFPPRSYTTNPIAKSRFAVYADKKENCNKLDLPDSISYSPQAMLDLFNKFDVKKNKKNIYDGFRIYFANYPATDNEDSGKGVIPPGRYDKMALLFVPTVGDGIPKHPHTDQIQNCWTIMGNSFVLLDPKFAGKWIRKAEQRYLMTFEAKGPEPSKRPDYKESRSLWYPSKIFKDPIIGFRGLIHYLTCRINCTKDIDSIYIHMGGFTKSDSHKYNYQLSLVFDYHGKNGSNSFLLPYEKAAVYIKKHNLNVSKETLAFVQQYTDTGKPCPPPNEPGACSTNGAILANQ
jgi:hypothetical protein